jgi:predicted exporter
MKEIIKYTNNMPISTAALSQQHQRHVEVAVCGLQLDDVNEIAQKAVSQYRQYVFMRSFTVDNPAARTLLTALYYCQEALHNLTADGNLKPFFSQEGNVAVPGEPNFPGLDHATVSFPAEEQQRAREYLQALRRAVGQELLRAVNKNAEVRKWWLVLQKRRFMNRML